MLRRWLYFRSEKNKKEKKKPQISNPLAKGTVTATSLTLS